jgi:hypothetical protein
VLADRVHVAKVERPAHHGPIPVGEQWSDVPLETWRIGRRPGAWPAADGCGGEFGGGPEPRLTLGGGPAVPQSQCAPACAAAVVLLAGCSPARSVNPTPCRRQTRSGTRDRSAGPPRRVDRAVCGRRRRCRAAPHFTPAAWAMWLPRRRDQPDDSQPPATSGEQPPTASRRFLPRLTKHFLASPYRERPLRGRRGAMMHHRR